MRFESLAPDVLRLSLRGQDFLNVYLLGDVLVDAGGRAMARDLLQALEGHNLRAHAITHGHFDHQGGSHAVCAHFGIELWCGAGDREGIETGRIDRLMQPRPVLRAISRVLGGPGPPVARVLREGDEVAAGFGALETPGHTPGSVSYWRAEDGVLVLGDVAWALNPFTMRRGLREPYAAFSFDAEQNRASLRRLAALGPRLVCFGHGPPAVGERFLAFVDGLRVSVPVRMPEPVAVPVPL